MKSYWVIFLALVALNVCGVPQIAEAQQANAVVSPGRSQSCSVTNLESAVTVYKSSVHSPSLSLCEGHALIAGGTQLAQGQPKALASGDFDEDGVPDLVSGFALGKSGLITIHRGNIHALWPYGAAALDGPPAAFFPDARTFTLPEPADLIAVGDFDADGHWDVVVAHLGSTSLYFLRGDGRGGFATPKRISLDGNITAMISGEMNRPDGLADLIVAVNGSNGSRVLIFESPRGAINAQPEVFALPQAATAVALGRLDGSAMHDLAIAAGDQLVVIHGRDRQLSGNVAQNASVPSAKVTRQQMPFQMTALVAGDFTGATPSLAALGADGRIHILEHAKMQSTLSDRLLNDPNFEPTMQLASPDRDGKPVILSGTATPAKSARIAAMRQALKTTSSAEWTEHSTVSLPAGFAQATPHLVAGRLTGATEDDIVVADRGNRQIHVLSTETGTRRSANAMALRENAATPEPVSMKLLASLDAESAPAAVLPMRLNQHGLKGLVALHEGQSQPTLMPQAIQPDHIFTVTNTSDITAPGGTPPAGSLRAAMKAVQAAFSNDQLPCSIVFNIPTTDPNYNASTGVFLIRPLSENVPNSLDNFALPPINATVTIDGYTQPGASPNTLTIGDNAKILIQIDGSRATTPGGSGLVPFDDSGSTYRGLVFTGWVTPAISGGTASGAFGMEENGIADFVEGNFFGTNAAGTAAAPNRMGFFGDNGPGTGITAGNIIGGTTPQARNIFSGNNLSGAVFLATAYESHLEGNYVGLNAAGTSVLPNGATGASLNGATVTIGGTLPGSRNVITGNPTNVDINDLTNGGAASNSIVQGNLIGTDPTGTVGLSPTSNGVSILHNPTNMTIGGTTPAARNIISGNNRGVYVFDGAFFNTIQGNYIGTDVTGTHAVGNILQGFISGKTNATGVIPGGGSTIGGSALGAGNLISGNGADGIEISGTSNGQTGSLPLQGNFILGNFIGTDATGQNALPNNGNGIYLNAGATNNIIGGSQPGSGNLIANNSGNGVLIDPGTATPGQGTGNNTIANTIFSNSGAGVRIATGTSNRISQNSIFQNKALGIDTDAAGHNINNHCNIPNTGANNLQNAPVLTAGSGSIYISATATDPNGNTSEFSNAVKATETGNILSLLGSFDSTASTSFTIEFFSSTAADSSGYGQGQTYLGSTTVTTGAGCTVAVSDPVDVTQADMSVSLTKGIVNFQTGPDLSNYTYIGTITNNGAATAHNVVFTDPLPSSVQVSSQYCLVGACQTPITTTLGACTASSNTITCNLGTMPPGATATVTIPVQFLSPGSVANTATVSATETDPNLANNTSTQTSNVTYPFAFLDHVVPSIAQANTPNPLPLILYGTGFVPGTLVTFNGTALTVNGVLDNQLCGLPFNPSYCTGLLVTVPPSLLTAAGTPNIIVDNPGVNSPNGVPFTIASSCTYNVSSFLDTTVSSDGTNLLAETVSVTTNLPSCPWTATSTVPWAVVLDNANATGSATVDVAFASNPTTSTRSGSVTVAGQTFNFTQAAGTASTCTYSLNSNSVSMNSAGGPGTFNATLSPSSCAPFVEPYASWIKINTSSLVTASGPVNFTVAANNGPARTGSMTVGGTVFTVNQAAPACYFTLDTTSALVPAPGGTGSFKVTATPSTCSWTATSSNSSQVTVTSGGTGTGSGSVNYTVATNTGGPITPTISIGNASATSVFSIQQASANTCTFSISPSPLTVSSDGTSDRFSLTPSFGFCKWTAVSNNPSAIAVTENSSGTGSSLVYFTVAQNTTGAPRTITITAGCQTFTVNQDAPATSNPVPAVTTLQPASVAAGSGAFTLTVNGSNFMNGSTVNFNGNARTTTFVSSTQLTAAIPASDVTSSGTPAVTVTNPAPGGGTSNAVTFTITAANNPVPAITTLQPSTIAAGSAAFTLTVNGSNFVSSSVVKFNGNAKTTTFVSSTQLTAAISASDVASGGTPAITVTNPAPGGGTSNSVTFTITAASNPVPAITTLQPSTIAAGSTAFTLTVNGSNFVSTSIVKFNGNTKTTTFVSATQLTAPISASDVATAGTPAVTVTNPAPGGGTSNAVTFTITAASNPVPAITALQPSTISAGSAAFTLTVNGSNFVSSSVVNFNGSAKNTTFVSATQLTAAISAGDVASVGTPGVTVTNPTPGGGTSNSMTFTISAAAPQVTFNPTSVSFPSTQAGTTSAAQNISLSNAGGSVLNITGISITGANPSDFGQTNTCGATLAPGTSCSISVTFTPVSAASFTASLSVADNASTSPQTVALSGTGIAAPSFSMTSSPKTQTVKPGAAAQFTITVSATNGTFPNAVTLAVAGLPAGATASFAPQSITPGSSSATSQLTIQTAASNTTASAFRSSWPFAATMLPFLGLLLPKGRRRARWILGIFILVTLGAVSTLTGCSGGFGSSGSGGGPSGSTTITVTGTSGSVQQSTTVQLVVQP